jgi:hypothetical protein
MAELRRAKRKPPEEPVQVVDAMTGASVGRVGNLSINGMMLIADAPMREDALFQFVFQLPDGKGNKVSLEIGFHEQWSEPANVPGQHWAGFRIIDIAPHDAEILEAWVEREGAA